jgi:hypothetical protein
MTSRVAAKVDRVDAGVRAAFCKVRDELDDHLDTINRTSGEVQSLYEFLVSLERKVDKLAERLDDAQADATMGRPSSLSLREQEVFLLLYASDGPLAASSLADRLGLTAAVVGRVVTGLVEKGVPVLQQGVVDCSYSLELRFKELQAREGIVVVDECVSRSLIES